MLSMYAVVHIVTVSQRTESWPWLAVVKTFFDGISDGKLFITTYTMPREGDGGVALAGGAWLWCHFVRKRTRITSCHLLWWDEVLQSRCSGWYTDIAIDQVKISSPERGTLDKADIWLHLPRDSSLRAIHSSHTNHSTGEKSR